MKKKIIELNYPYILYDNVVYVDSLNQETKIREIISEQKKKVSNTTNNELKLNEMLKLAGMIKLFKELNKKNDV